jgi:beta-glucanase (GH16 family)
MTRHTCVCLLAGLLLLGCGGSGGGGDGGGEPAPPADRTAPTVTITDDVAGAMANGPVEFSFVFSEDPGDSFGAADIVVGGGAPAALVRAGATRYTLSVAPPADATGTLTVSVAAGRFSDAAGNANTAAVLATQAFDTRTDGAPDRTAPTVTITDDMAGATANGPVVFSFVFSEDPGDSFGADDVVVGGGVPATLLRADATRYTLSVAPPADAAGTLAVGVAAGRFSDAAGNANTAAVLATQDFDTRLAGWTLVWADEFEADGLPDASKWDYDTERNAVGWFNGELQYYARNRPENARVEGGRLIITARKEQLSAAADWGGQNYTSARLVTRGKASWTYGFFEVRARLPCGQGTWPAIWTLGTGGRWPEDGEIDILEQTGWNKAEVLGTIHTRAYNYFNGTLGVGQGARTALPSACTAFHNYQLTWTAEHIRIGVDGVQYFEFANPNAGDPTRWPFDNPQYLILNLAIGGSLGGAVDPAFTEQRMEVDYVRVYRR